MEQITFNPKVDILPVAVSVSIVSGHMKRFVAWDSDVVGEIRELESDKHNPETSSLTSGVILTNSGNAIRSEKGKALLTIEVEADSSLSSK